MQNGIKVDVGISKNFHIISQVAAQIAPKKVKMSPLQKTILLLIEHVTFSLRKVGVKVNSENNTEFDVLLQGFPN